ncbi:MAG TPA: hypothetical protein VGK02_08295 [Candidatus Aquicultor sp.]|jgi:methionyl-tRNA formyltransferase
MPKYKITIASDQDSWINQYIPLLIEKLESEGNEVFWVHAVDEIMIGDFAFYLGCGQLVKPPILARNAHNLVVHESDLPKGKGWSPLTWQILEGKNNIPICLFEAAESIDSGRIYLKGTMEFKGTELIDELRYVQANTSIKICLTFVRNYPSVITNGFEQEGESTYYKKREPDDSRLNPDRTIREQFNLLRVVDNQRYPAFFKIDGTTYILRIENKEPI